MLLSGSSQSLLVESRHKFVTWMEKIPSHFLSGYCTCQIGDIQIFCLQTIKGLPAWE